MAIVVLTIDRNAKDDSARVYLKDESRLEAPSVEAIIYRSHVGALPELGVGDCILLKQFVCFSGKKIPYLESTKSSAWCVWGSSGVPVCHQRFPVPQLSNMQSLEMQRLCRWWASHFNVIPII